MTYPPDRRHTCLGYHPAARPARKITAALLATALTLLSASCRSTSGRGYEAPTTPDSAATQPADTPIADTPTSSPTDDPTNGTIFHQMAFNLQAPDGSKIEANMSLAPIQPAGSQELTANWSGLAPGAGFPCEAQAGRDGIVIGALQLLNDTPTFSASLKLQFGGTRGFAYSLGENYDGDPRCHNTADYGDTDISPSFQTTSWGPVAIEFVIPNYYSPAHPQGDPSLLNAESVYFIPRTVT